MIKYLSLILLGCIMIFIGDTLPYLDYAHTTVTIARVFLVGNGWYYVMQGLWIFKQKRDNR